jgi:3-aminobutyryl-CoA ammonia-lyase
MRLLGMVENGMKSMIRVRMGMQDAHYGGNLVDGAKILSLFGDIATELLIRLDGDEGLFLRYDEVEFLAPVHAGDYIEAEGSITRIGNTSRNLRFEARKVVEALSDANHPSRARYLENPLITTRATGVCVTPKSRQQIKP